MEKELFLQYLMLCWYKISLIVVFSKTEKSAKKFCVEITGQLSLESQPLLLYLFKELDKLHVAKRKDQNCHEKNLRSVIFQALYL